MPARIPDHTRANIHHDIREGAKPQRHRPRAWHQPDTVSRIARDAGIAEPFAPGDDQSATEAAIVDNDMVWAATARRLLAKVNELISDMSGPVPDGEDR